MQNNFPEGVWHLPGIFAISFRNGVSFKIIPSAGRFLRLSLHLSCAIIALATSLYEAFSSHYNKCNYAQGRPHSFSFSTAISRQVFPSFDMGVPVSSNAVTFVVSPSMQACISSSSLNISVRLLKYTGLIDRNIISKFTDWSTFNDNNLVPYSVGPAPAVVSGPVGALYCGKN